MSEPPAEPESESQTGLRSDARSEGSQDNNGPGFGAFRQLTLYSVLGGLCPLVPVPFLDDWLLGRVKRWMLTDLDRILETELGREARVILAGGRDPWKIPGCVGGCLWVLQKGIFKLAVKLFRKVLYFLAVREGLHAATRVFHEGYLAMYGLRSTSVPDTSVRQQAHARKLRAAALETIESMDLQPVLDIVRRTFHGSWGLLIRASRVLARPFFRRKARREEEGDARAAEQAREKGEELLGGLVDRLAARLWGNREYFERLEREFDQRLDERLEEYPS